MKIYPFMNSIKTHEIDIGLAPKVHSYTITERPVKKSSKHFYKVKKNLSSKPHSIITSTNSKKQNCTLIIKFRPTKVQHVKNLEYIEKDGKGLDGDKPLLYGSDSKEDYEKQMTEKNWRIILAPDSNKIPLTLFTKEFIKKVEECTGYKLTWIASDHYDTPHHHTHVLINGIDKNGKTVDFLKFKALSKNLFREYAKDLCTSLIGPRTESQIRQSLEEASEKNYFTSLDKTLIKYMNGNILTKSYMSNKNESILNKRLDYLVKLKLAEWNKSKQLFIFQNNWIEELKKMGKYNTYLDGFKFAKCEPENYYLHDIKEMGSIEGKILKKYTMQKDSNNFALIIKKKDGRVGYVPLHFYPTKCFVGDEIKIEKKQSKTYIRNFSKNKGNS